MITRKENTIKQIFAGFFIFFTLASCCALGALFYTLEQPWVDFSRLEHYNPGKPTILLDNAGNEWARFQLDRRQVISLQQMPKHLINAFVAAEDWQFFTHGGISIKGIIRSVLINIYNKRIVQGASTITQQLVKLLFLNAEKSFKRKIKEQFVALMVERQFTKEQILETYLNHVYFGSGIYGVEAAAQRFWGKQSKDLCLDQAAILAAIVRSPRKYSPLLNPKNALQRRNTVLHSMAKLEFISQQEYTHAREQALDLATHSTHERALHVKESIRVVLEELLGKQALYTGGFTVQTTLNSVLQEKAEALFNKHITKLRSTIAPDLEGALISIEGGTGAIQALIGGYDFKQSQFNRALKARRQVGSTFKPLIYAQALQEGKQFTTIEIDEPLTLIDNGKEWSPQNFNHRFEGPITLAQALSRSNNIVAIKTLLQINPQAVIKLAQECNFQGMLYPYPSLALGCVDGTLQEVANYINIFAHHGVYAEPHALMWIKDEWGTKVWKYKAQHKQVLPGYIADQVGHVLTLALEKTRKSNPKHWFDCDALGKTGTTNDARTCWFAGATPTLTTAVYIGCDNNKPMGKNVYAVSTAFPIWKEFNQEGVQLTKQQPKQFQFDSTLKKITIDGHTGKPTNPESTKALTILTSPSTDQDYFQADFAQ